MIIDLETAFASLPRDSIVESIYLLGRVLWEGRGVLRSVAMERTYDRTAVAVVARLVDDLEARSGVAVTDLPEKSRRALSEDLDRLLRRTIPPTIDPGSVERELAALRKIAI